MTYEATYSFNVRRHLRVEIEAESDEEAERIAKEKAMEHIDAEITAIQNSDSLSDTERLEPWLYLDRNDSDGTGSDVICEEQLPDPEAAPRLPDPLPVDLIVASRELVSAFGGNVPDWLQNEIGMLELALAPFAAVQPPMPPKARTAAERDATHAANIERQEIADGAYGDGPMRRGLARDAGRTDD